MLSAMTYTEWSKKLATALLSNNDGKYLKYNINLLTIVCHTIV